MRRNVKKQALVAISGGVDSAVSAALLKKQGYNVVGVYLRLLGPEASNDHEKAAGNAAKKIKIPFHIIDLRKEFKKVVVDYFLREYQKGRTPNPCVVCNQEIKFKFLFKALSGLNADYIATGHYARISPHPSPSPSGRGWHEVTGEGVRHLFVAKDKTKDQSYFLYTLNQKQLSKILFPLGNYDKDKVKKIAENFRLINNPRKNNNRLHLPSADNICSYKESQNICFIIDKYPDKFLKRHLKLKKGNIFNLNGKIIGKHEGLPLYTIGQRRGIKIGGTGPYYVVGKDEKKNLLVVTNRKNDPALYKKEAALEKVNWVVKKPKLPVKVLVRNRYHDPLTYAKIKMQGTEYKIQYANKQKAVTPGQSAVFYSKRGEVIGGGVIID